MAMADDNSFPENSDILKWCHLMNEGGLKAGIKLRCNGDDIKDAMERAGFTDVTLLKLKLPIGLWPADPTLKEAGKFAVCAMLQGLQGISLALFTRHLGWQVDEMEVFLAQVRNEWRKKRVHSYWPM
jgi:hypothetical protein